MTLWYDAKSVRGLSKLMRDNSVGERHEKQKAPCARCQGFMVPSYSDTRMLESMADIPTTAWRCVNCGDRIDPTIITNREHASQGNLPKAQARASYERRR